MKDAIIVGCCGLAILFFLWLLGHISIWALPSFIIVWALLSVLIGEKKVDRKKK